MKSSQRWAGVIRLGISAYVFLVACRFITDSIAKADGDFSSPTFVGENIAYWMVLLYGLTLAYWSYSDIKEKPIGLLALKLTFILFCSSYGLLHVYTGLLGLGTPHLLYTLQNIFITAVGVVIAGLAIYDIKAVMARRGAKKTN